MKTFINQAAQGDILIRRVTSIPANFRPVEDGGRIVVGHSETGHHHAIDSDGVVRYEGPDNPLICYLRMETVETAELVHHRPWDTHESIGLTGRGAIFEIRRQREFTPSGWARVRD